MTMIARSHRHWAITVLLFLVLSFGWTTPSMAEAPDPADVVIQNIKERLDAADRGIGGLSSTSNYFAGDRWRDNFRSAAAAIPLEQRRDFRTGWLEGMEIAKRWKERLATANNVLKALEYCIDFYKPLRDGNFSELTVQAAGLITKIVTDKVLDRVGNVLCATMSAATGFAAPGTFVLCTLATNWVAGKISDKVEEYVERRVREALAKANTASQPAPSGINGGGGGAQAPPTPATVAEGARARLAGIINLSVRTGDVTTTAKGESTAVANVGVALGDGNAKVDVNVRGPITTAADGKSKAYTGIGVTEGNNATASVQIEGGVTTRASGRSDARTEVGVAKDGKTAVRIGGNVTTVAKDRAEATALIGAASDGGQAVVTVRRDVTTTASGKAKASNTLGVARNHGQATVAVGEGVTANASGSGKASNEVGVADKGNVNVRISGSINALASGTGAAQNQIGQSSGGNVNVYGGGSVNTLGSSGGSSSTKIGQGQSVYLKGSVINKNGNLEIGGACAAQRNGQCCIEIHRLFCVLQKVPPHKGQCPPRFEQSAGMCYLYSDKKHSIH